MGGINSKKQPIICGGEGTGSTYYKECYSFDKTSWILSEQMPYSIAHASVAQSTFSNQSHQFIFRIFEHSLFTKNQGMGATSS